MADTTGISWTDCTFNPWMGCSKVSEGCRNCYAAALTKNRMGLDVWGPVDKRRRTSVANWKKPLDWNRQAERQGHSLKVFCGSLMDVFEDAPLPNATRPELWAIIRDTRWLIWQLLTKRAQNIGAMLPPDWGNGYPNVWLGTSVEDMRVACRIRELTANPASVHFISHEPALGPLHEADLSHIEWIITGGESGPGYRNMEQAWSCDLWRACRDRGIAYYYKQDSAPRAGMRPWLVFKDGSRWKIQQYPGNYAPPQQVAATA